MKNLEEIYDELAFKYDRDYSDKKIQAENEFLKAMIPYKFGSILDAGCGTGLLMDLVNIKPSDYTGIDISTNMLAVAKKKYAKYKFKKQDFFDHKQKHDCVISLFGIPDHCGIDVAVDHSYDLLNERGLYISTFINANGPYKKLKCFDENGYDQTFNAYSVSEINQKLQDKGFAWYYILGIANIKECADVQKTANQLINDRHKLRHCKYYFVMAEK